MILTLFKLFLFSVLFNFFVIAQIDSISDVAANKSNWFTVKNNSITLFSYSQKDFSINLNPVIIFKQNYIGTEPVRHTANGITLNGYMFSDIDYSFTFYDNHEKWESIRKLRKFSRETGIHNFTQGDYSELLINLSYKFNKGEVSVGKGYFNVGSGVDGKLILSNKAPSFPFINFTYTPVEWFSFNYLHGWLNSTIVDSNTVRSSSSSINIYSKSYDRRNKYISFHQVILKPWNNVSLSLGESVIYSDNIEFLYLIPINFFRLSDHYLSNGDTGDNSQMFADLKVKVPQINSSFYSTLFIDELQLGKLLDDDATGNKHIGFTLGSEVTDPVFSNSSFNVEYTRINPFVYMNFNPAQTYESSGYQLGHWIGSNADQFHLSYTQGLFSTIQCNIRYDYIRKGEKETTDQQYNFNNPPFLFGERSIYEEIGLSVVYEPISPLKVYLQYSHLLKATNRFVTEYDFTEKNSVLAGVSFGL